jgi:hypothetical protein
MAIPAINIAALRMFFIYGFLLYKDRVIRIGKDGSNRPWLLSADEATLGSFAFPMVFDGLGKWLMMNSNFRQKNTQIGRYTRTFFKAGTKGLRWTGGCRPPFSSVTNGIPGNRKASY